MLTNQTIKSSKFLLPLSFIYGLVVRVRNSMFNHKILKSESYDIPIICIGNLAVGGTGKTPHTEYIIRMLKERYRIAVLSRGYKRESSGFILANDNSSSRDIGDEPYQMKRKFPDIIVAVDADRRRGIRKLLSLGTDIRPEVILLDDAFQHRYVTPSLNILLTDSHRIYTKDRLLPYGRLREPKEGAERADVIIVTKCEEDIQPIEFRIIEEEIHLAPYQKLFYSKIVYGELEPLFKGVAKRRELSKIESSTHVILISGIASPEPLLREVGKQTKSIISITFPDHHSFDKQDIKSIESKINGIDSDDKIIITTEKDAARLRDLPFLPKSWQSMIYCLPITIAFRQGKESQFMDLIYKHIETFTLKRI